MPVCFRFEENKAMAALVWIASRSMRIAELDKYKISKLIFLADKCHLVRYGRPITGDVYCALPYGPVPSNTLDLLNQLEKGSNERLAQLLELDRRYRYPRLSAISDTFARQQLSESDRAALDWAVDHFGHMTFDELKAITHQMPAYRKVWDEKPEHRNSEPMSYEDFFEEDPEAVAGAFEEMLENDELRKAFPL